MIARSDVTMIADTYVVYVFKDSVSPRFRGFLMDIEDLPRPGFWTVGRQAVAKPPDARTKATASWRSSASTWRIIRRT